MEVKVKNFLNGSPQFQETKPITEGALLTENRTIARLKPSELSQNKILLFILRIFQRILNWLYPFERIPYVGIVAAFDRGSAQNTLTQDQALSYFRRFFKADTLSSPQLVEAIDQLQEQVQAIETLQMSQKDASDEKLRKRFESWVQNVESLEEGKQRLIIANAQSSDALFYLFSKKGGELSLKIIGRGQTMVRLSGIEEIAIAGKAKIVASLDYERIDAAFVRELLAYSPLGGKEIGNPSFEGLLKDHRVAARENSLDSLATKTEDLFKSIWTVLRQVHETAGGSKAEFQRTNLRLKVFTLFGLLKEYRHTLTSTPNHRETLTRMLRLCAQSLVEAENKKIVNQKEIEELVQELTVVQKAIDAAALSTKIPIPSLKMRSMELYSVQALSLLTPPAALSVSEPKVTLSRRPPHLTPPKIGGNKILHRETTASGKVAPPAIPIPSQLARLVEEKSSPQEIVQAIYDIEFSPYQKDQHFNKYEECVRKESPWISFSKTTAEKMMNHLNTLSRRLVDFSRKEKELPVDVYEVLIKLSYMVAFLTHHYIARGKISFETQKLFQKILNFDVKTFARYLHDTNRYGCCIHSRNMQTHHQMRAFHFILHSMGSEDGVIGGSRFSGPLEALAFLQNQVDLLEFLIPCHPYNVCQKPLDEFSSITSSIYGWTAPLPSSLLAAYHTLGMLIEDKEYLRIDGGSKYNYRNTPESLQHDPFNALRSFEHLLFEREVQPWRKDLEMELEQTPHSGYKQGSLFVEEVKRRHLKELLKRQEAYFHGVSQHRGAFQKEELTALLSLLRARDPQKEVLAFLHAHESMLKNPSVRAFVQLFFFHHSFLTMYEYATDFHFLQLMPSVLKEKIIKYKERAKEDASALDLFLFFVQMSEKLKGIYEAFQKNIEMDNDPSYQKDIFKTKQALFDKEHFFQIENGEIQELLENLRKKDPTSPGYVEGLALQLKIFLKKPDLSQAEVCRLILDMHRLQRLVVRTPIFDYQELFWIKGDFQKLLQALTPDFLDKNHLQYLLDTLRHEQGLLLDHSSWNGAFPFFQNGQYRVDLETGRVTYLDTDLMITTLPNSLKTLPLFKKSFSDLLHEEEVRVTKKEAADGTTIYLFQDEKKNPCRIEEKEGRCSFYRSFPEAGHPEMLQAAFFTEQEKRPTLPALFQKRLFIDPQVPEKGYLLSFEGELQFELTLKQETSGVKIEEVIDLREGKRSEPMQLISLAEVDQPALKALEQIEDPAHILIWGKKGGSMERIELIRYGLQFALQEGSLVCTDPRYVGYEVRLSASLEERKGFALSLLLEHSDRSRPKKLFVAPSDAIRPGESREPAYYGLAYVIWLIKRHLSLLFGGSLPKPLVSPHLHIETERETLQLISLDLRSHTEEIVCTPGKWGEQQSKELILQALKLGNETLALEVLHSLTIEEEKHTLARWLLFLTKSLNKELPQEAAIGLKVAEKILTQLHEQKKYKKLIKQLHAAEVDLFKGYLKGLRKLKAPLRLSNEAFQRISEQLKESDPLYYQKHLTPFFLNVGDLFSLPIQMTDGTTFELPELLSSPEEEIHQERLSEIVKLENLVQPDKTLDRASLGHHLPLLKDPVSLVFDPSELAPYFHEKSGELVDGKALLKKIEKKRKDLEDEKSQEKERLNSLLFNSSDPLEQLAIYAKEKQIASPTDLLFALLQKNFEGLQEKLPQGIDLQKLRATVMRFYDLEVKLHLLISCEKELSIMLEERGQMASSIWSAKSTALFDQLIYRRQYNPEECPELLAFEAFHFITFRNTSHPSQLELLQQLIAKPAAIVQAGTGAGKSSVLSILRALMLANGKNLVTQKVLPHLFKETLTLFQERLGSTFKKKIYPLLFNQSMPLYDKKGNSLFERIYYNLLKTIQNKGCVLTDYKSFVLLEQKFFSLNKQIVANQKNDVLTPPIWMIHWFYLTKILILLKNKDNQLMDEFDQPLSAVQRIQTQMREGGSFDGWMIEKSLEIFDLLLKEKSLFLAENLQGDVYPFLRQIGIHKLAEQLAKNYEKGAATKEKIYNYLIGSNEEVLDHLDGWSPEEKDILAFLKDQCTTYLPLTLSRSSSSDYTRSPDGKKILTCSKGEKREAKFGNPIEEINYTIQDYLQNGIALPTLREWILTAKKDWEEKKERHEDPGPVEMRFHKVIPKKMLSLKDLEELSPDDFEDRMEKLFIDTNQDPQIVRYFLKQHLRSLKYSGMTISMNPQDSVAMSCAVSGVSATTGSLGSLHSQFEADADSAKDIQKEMVERLRQRSVGLIPYDPLAPLYIFQFYEVQDARFCAVIDGCGAFRSFPPEKVAQALLAANSSLKRVGFYDKEGRESFVGDPNATFAERGFYFPQAQTRGSDQLLRPDGLALLMTNEKGGIEDFLQEEGRMRHPQQKVLVALSVFAGRGLRSLDALIEHKKRNQEVKNAEDRYRAEIQRLGQMRRRAAREDLLAKTELKERQKPLDELKKRFDLPDTNKKKDRLIQEAAQDFVEECKPFLDRFKEFEPLFIQAFVEIGEPGSYFANHQRLLRRNADPVDQLKSYQGHLLDECRKIGIVSEELKAYDATKISPYLPEKVLPFTVAEQQQQEVQEEIESDQQFAVEEEEEQHKEEQVGKSKVDAYLPRLPEKESIPASQLHKAFSDKIALTDPYLPLNRKDPLHKRKPFDERTSRIGSISIAAKLSYLELDLSNRKWNNFDHKILQAIRMERDGLSLEKLAKMVDQKTSLFDKNEIEEESINGKINQSLEKLVNRGLIKRLDTDGPTRYCALPEVEIKRIYIEDPLGEVEHTYHKREEFCNLRYDIRMNRITSESRPVRLNKEAHSLIAQVKFLDGMFEGYTDEELEELDLWLKQYRAQEMYIYFSETILKNRPPEYSERFFYSQLWNLFKEGIKASSAAH